MTNRLVFCERLVARDDSKVQELVDGWRQKNEIGGRKGVVELNADGDRVALIDPQSGEVFVVGRNEELLRRHEATIRENLGVVTKV